MTENTESTLTPVSFYFDPTCPWAWMTSRWILEAQQVRDINVTFKVMSLAVLNEGRDLSPEYQEHLRTAWWGVRVIVAARELHGEEYVRRLYDAIGTRLHPGQQKDRMEVIKASLAEVGLPADLIRFAESDEYDEQLRESHAEAMRLVGNDVGTPVIVVGDVGFFGPVISPAPKGEAAGRLWDGVLLVGGTPGFYEIKRTRTTGPIFD
ncbi:DsbA family protein [Micrococcales bacterium 31B]|nr:DsbA family protein [Micrococcales bacterium 31B]